jgi:DDE family transposase
VFQVRLCLPGIPHMHHNPLRRRSLRLTQPCPRLDVFAAIPDFRQPRGQRHPCTALGALACGAMLCGERSERARAAWGRHSGARLAQARGCTPDTPWAATLHTLFRRVHRAEVEAHLGAWADSGVGSLPAALETPEGAMAVDGKTLRGSTKQVLGGFW